jgi:hypothetical protein
LFPHKHLVNAAGNFSSRQAVLKSRVCSCLLRMIKTH